jgi:lysyl-tRNA synthetase class 1
MYKDHVDGKTDEFLSVVMDDCLIEVRRPETVPMSLLVQFGSIVDFNVPMLERVFEKVGTPYKAEDFKERLPKAKYWLENCSPESVYKLRPTRNFEVYNVLTEPEKKEIARLYEVLVQGGYDLDGLQTLLYAIPKEALPENAGDKELKTAQGAFFKNVYRLLIDKERGPRLYLFLYAIEKDSYLKLLDFSTPKTEEEERIEREAQEAEAKKNAVPEKKIEYGEPDPFAPVKPGITIDDFLKTDLRVAKVLKCQEIRKSHSCYKLTLFDGEGERVIVSSIKAYYEPEQLVGRKIIIVANLAPARIAGVESRGMLLAGTNNACGCKVVFVDDMVPEGTMIK